MALSHLAGQCGDTGGKAFPHGDGERSFNFEVGSSAREKSAGLPYLT